MKRSDPTRDARAVRAGTLHRMQARGRRRETRRPTAPLVCPSCHQPSRWLERSGGPRRVRSRLVLPRDLRAQTVLLRAQLRRELLAEVVGLEDRSNLELRLFTRHRIRTATYPLDRLVHRLHLPQPEAGDELLRLGERAVNDGA